MRKLLSVLSSIVAVATLSSCAGNPKENKDATAQSEQTDIGVTATDATTSGGILHETTSSL